MIINYTKVGNIIYLKLNFEYDFGNFNKNNTNFKNEIKKYFNNLKIDLNNKKIILVCSGIIIGTLIVINNYNKKDEIDFKYVPNIYTQYIVENKIHEKNNNVEELINDIESNDNIVKENININNNTQDNSLNQKTDNNIVNNATHPSVSNITIYRSNGVVDNIELEEYIVGVVAGEMPASFNIEALKAQAVVARTYALNAKVTNKKLTDTVSTQRYIDIEQMKSTWGSSFNTYYNKIKNAVDSTKGQVLTYNGNYIEVMYHSTSNGNTESSLDVFGNYYPYLISVNSSYDLNASSYLRTTNLDINMVNNILGSNINNESIIEIISKTSGENIKEIAIDGKVFSGKEIREKLSLRSTDFDININDNLITFTTRGYGHGVGMSQYGANGMANAGYKYSDILLHYYPGTVLR